MSVLRTIESKLESLFEGLFGRTFRSHVQPVEIARKLVKEMDEHRSVSVSRVYAPNRFTVYLSPVDREQFDGYDDKLCEELQDYLAEHARRERYVLLDAPSVSLDTDPDLEMGMFGIHAQLVRAPSEPAPAASVTAIYEPPVPLPVMLPQEDEADGGAEHVALTVAGRRHELDVLPVILGRSKESDIQVLDPNVSRRHAELRLDGGVYTLVDLGSTNGIEVDGRRVRELELSDGARFTIGSTEVTFSRETH